MDPFSEPYPLWHASRFEKLTSIIREGIIAGDFASKIGKKDYASEFGMSWNKKYVSLNRGGNQGYLSGGEVSFLVAPRDELISATTLPLKPWDHYEPVPGELLVKSRISPRELKGIQVWQGPDLTKTVTDIVGIFQSMDPKLSLPIYTVDGLVWPQKLTRDQLRERAKTA